MRELLLFLGTAFASAVIIRGFMGLAHARGLIDQPGEHKAHKRSTPFVGGTGIYFATVIGLLLLWNLYPQLTTHWLALGLGATIIFITGFIDDLFKLGFRIRLMVQTVVALVMVLWAGVVLADLGNLWFGMPLVLGLLAIPFTVFATVGGINALNMVDGMDGLAGLLALVTLALITLLTWFSGPNPYVLLNISLLGGLAGFLFYNMRHPTQRYAKVFLGDNGSMLLGFLFAWILVDISQGPEAIIPPVAALWLFAIPLLDTLSVIGRRLWMRRSPFSPDRNHLHHLLQRAGYRVDDVVIFVVLLHLVLASLGLVLLGLGVSDWVMFLAFIGLFITYLYITLRPRRIVPALRRLHTRLRLMPAATSGIYIGHEAVGDPDHLAEVIARELDHGSRFRLRVCQRMAPCSRGTRYALLEIPLEDDEASCDAIRRYTRRIRDLLQQHEGLEVRPLVQRDPENDPRLSRKKVYARQREQDRRDSARCTTLYEAYFFVRAGKIADKQVRRRDGNPTTVDQSAVEGTPPAH